MNFQPHAEYHSTYPLPICGTITGKPSKAPAKPIKARRVLFAMDRIEDFSKAKGFVERTQDCVDPKAPRFDRYRPFLSAKYKTTSEIADEMGLHRVTVNKFLRSQLDLVDKKAVATAGGYSVNYWRLK